MYKPGQCGVLESFNTIHIRHVIGKMELPKCTRIQRKLYSYSILYQVHCIVFEMLYNLHKIKALLHYEVVFDKYT